MKDTLFRWAVAISLMWLTMCAATASAQVGQTPDQVRRILDQSLNPLPPTAINPPNNATGR